MASTCFFNDCTNVIVAGSWKCQFHKNRARCLVNDCRNQVYARSLCVRHGGKRQCDTEGCGRNVRIGNFCSFHGTGPAKKRCTAPGCSKVAHKRQLCVRHGGGRKCKVDACPTHARSGGYCCRHSRVMAKQVQPTEETIVTPAPIAYFPKHELLDIALLDDMAKMDSLDVLHDFDLTLDLKCIDFEPSMGGWIDDEPTTTTDSSFNSDATEAFLRSGLFQV
ncbi:hypothetical protein LEN26_014680 [Aphanomyces euteiches]|nr:hypothetical protein LEN26_014680 [Aphanomyces euteiches]